MRNIWQGQREETAQVGSGGSDSCYASAKDGRSGFVS